MVLLTTGYGLLVFEEYVLSLSIVVMLPRQISAFSQTNLNDFLPVFATECQESRLPACMPVRQYVRREVGTSILKVTKVATTQAV